MRLKIFDEKRHDYSSNKKYMERIFLTDYQPAIPEGKWELYAIRSVYWRYMKDEFLIYFQSYDDIIHGFKPIEGFYLEKEYEDL